MALSLYTWSPDVPDDAHGLNLIPMLWGPDQVAEFQAKVKPGYANIALGFNECVSAVPYLLNSLNFFSLGPIKQVNPISILAQGSTCGGSIFSLSRLKAFNSVRLLRAPHPQV
jgi:hypothetical protein